MKSTRGQIVFKGIGEFEQHYFPEDCRKYPIRMRCTEEEKQLLFQMRGSWRKETEL